jgi:hypothetical protein
MRYCNCPACLNLMELSLVLTMLGDHAGADKVAAMVTVLDEHGNPVPYEAAPVADQYAGEGYEATWTAPAPDDATVN